jgi:hypothetical protein
MRRNLHLTRTLVRVRVAMVGMAYSFPEDLLKAQHDWYATYAALADAPAAHTAALRRSLLALSAQIVRHPFWDQPAHGPAARMALKQSAWSTA